MPESVIPFIHRKVVVLSDDKTVYEATRAMCENNVGSVLVSDGEGQMVGILTDRDVACALVSMNQSPDTKISEVMSRDLVAVSENDTVHDVIVAMKERGIRRVPVLHKVRGKYKRSVGMISLDDLVAARVVTIDDIADIVRAQVFRRQKALPKWSQRDIQSFQEAKFFLREFENRSGLSEARALAFVEVVLGLVIRRIHFTSAAHLVSYLPDRLASELLDLPAGPDRAIRGEVIIQEISSRFDMDRDQVKECLIQMWDALDAVAPEGVVAEIADELPDDIQALFVDLAQGVDQQKSSDLEVRPEA